MEVFDTPALTGTPSRVEVTPAVQYSWGRPTRQERDGAVSWSGWLKPETDSTYRFG